MKVQFFILAFLAITSTTAQSNTLADVVQAFQGFVNGVDQEINVEDVAPCINDAEAIFNSFVSAI
jgi:3-deoxy-D-arabino-heptulosonate 7-phosphate (DAHP) synthase class II